MLQPQKNNYPVDLSLLSDSEQEQVRCWNSTQLAYEQFTLKQLIEQQVRKTPQQVAVAFEGRELTYKELDLQAEFLAHRLHSLGVGPDVLVGVCLERSPNMIVALLAIFKAGGAYLPLDISYPIERLRFMLENAQAKVLLTQSHLADKLPAQGTEVVCLDAEPPINSSPPTLPEPDTTLDHLGYVIYTSGSTGKPKGVAMPQRALVNLTLWQRSQSPFSVGARTVQFTPISFDVSFQEIFSTLASGGTLVLIRDEQRRDPAFLLRFLESEQIERLFLPFVALRQLAEVAVREGIAPQALKQVITAGEQLRITSELVHWFRKMPNCSLHNHYGPSESHVVTAHTLTGDPETWPVLPAIGQPIANTQIHILDTQMRAVAPGKPGELYIAGDCLAHGYLNRPEITAERFIHHSFAGTSPTVLYKSGDLARYQEDGSIEYLGRSDQQVKIRGFRIEPGEIESVLERQPEVKEAIVLTRESSPNNPRLVAYVVVQSSHTETFSEAEKTPLERRLREVASNQLPDYMVPSAFVLLNTFPLTPSGKVDRRALPIPQWTRAEEGEYIAPRNTTERQIREIWAELLAIEQISVYDTFCSLGGHSILAVQLIYQLKERMDVDVELSRFLENSTIAGLSELIETIRNQGELENYDDDIEAAERKLDTNIQPPTQPNPSAPNYFLTGATGFLGTHLLYDLLQNTRADVYCLVRATSPAEGLARIQKNLIHQKLWHEQYAARIIPVVGSLSLPRLGIQPTIFNRLAEKLDAIYHCGSWVNVVYPYSVLEAANVTGTQEVLRLASQATLKPVHYISTVDVFRTGEQFNIRTVGEQGETAQTGPVRSLFSGYAKSKYIAETLIQEAQSRGIPTAIYRPSNIMGDTRSGISSSASFIVQMLQGCIKTGLAPQIDAALNLVPADYVSRAIIHLSETEIPQGQAFNIVNPQTYAWVDLVTWISKKGGYPIELVPYETWCSEVIATVSQDKEHELFFLSTFFTNLPFMQKSLGAFYFQCESLMQKLSSVSCAPVDDRLLTLYFNAMVQQGLLPPAAESDEASTGRIPLTL